MALPEDPSSGLDYNSSILKSMVADCTCPVCQGLMERPRMLRCKHVLCQRCLTRLHRRAKNNGSGAICPVQMCKEKFDPSKAESDPITESLLAVLRHIKCNLCNEPDCWQRPDFCCPDCNSLRCRKHHNICLTKLQTECSAICDSAEAFAGSYLIEEKLQDVTTIETTLCNLSNQLSTAMNDKITECKMNLEEQRSIFTKELNSSKPVLDEIRVKVANLKLLQATEDFPAMQVAQVQLRRLLARAKQLHPPMELAPPPPLDECLRGLKGVLAQVRVDTVVRPFGLEGGAAKLHRCLRTRPLQPWDMALLLNLTGVCITPDGGLAREFKAGCRTLGGPCLLLINFKGFPTKQLHVYDVDAREVAAVKLEMKKGEMPGKFALCNQRQLILASEPSQHCVFVFDLTGALISRFGKRGSDPGCFNEPMSLFPW